MCKMVYQEEISFHQEPNFGFSKTTILDAILISLDYGKEIFPKKIKTITHPIYLIPSDSHSFLNYKVSSDTSPFELKTIVKNQIRGPKSLSKYELMWMPALKSASFLLGLLRGGHFLISHQICPPSGNKREMNS